MSSQRPLRPQCLTAQPLSALTQAGSPVPVSGLSIDSRQVQAGDLYIALPGSRAHGASFAAQAVSRGAVGVFTDPAGAKLLPNPTIPVVVVDDPRTQMAALAVKLYGAPAAAMQTFAITGTNGKTTTAHLLEGGLLAAGQHPGVIGTIGFRLDGHNLEGARTTVTTPESTDLQALFAVMREGGADSIAMEVSSHALALQRVDQIVFDVAGFTNLGRDHLDFHHTEENYYAAKAKLFTPEHARVAVVDIDTPAGRRLCAESPISLRTVSVTDQQADYLATGQAQPDGSTLVRLRTPNGREAQTLIRLPGAHNVHNVALAAAMVDQAGVDLSAALAGFGKVRIPGRMQVVDLPAEAPTVYVDFAHTPQAVAAVGEAFGNRRGKLIIVLGCGGDRDPDKRAPMGAAAAQAGDLVIVTDDNPRSEDPAAIRAAVLAGAVAGNAVDGGDRRSAIARALLAAGADDIVAILGKGHEVGQEIAGTREPFDDVQVVTELWEQQS